MERTFVMVKPDGVHRGLIGEIIGRLERKGLRVVALKILTVERSQAEQLYKEHVGKAFYEGLLDYITSGPVVAMAVMGDEAVSLVRNIIGKTDPKEARAGTIRGDFGVDVSRNIVHGADSPESAARELNIFFDESDYIGYSRIVEDWVYP